MNHLEFQFTIEPPNPWSDIVTAYLSEIEFHGFYEKEGTLYAFISQEEFVQEDFQEIVASFEGKGVRISFIKNIIKHKNWNASWESNFSPVEIKEQLCIRAPFHERDEKFKLTIIIQPKMSFGTGHHQTTYLMCEAILQLDLRNKKILDMGAGTGVLAILCEKQGSTDITAIDIEEWSVENCIENTITNDCNHIVSSCGDVDLIAGKKFDVIFANINKNILKSHLQQYFMSLNENGLLYLSGFFVTDANDLQQLAESLGLKYISINTKDEWAMLILQK
jgi:ribosomal protein L11 methyltransferase